MLFKKIHTVNKIKLQKTHMQKVILIVALIIELTLHNTQCFFYLITLITLNLNITSTSNSVFFYLVKIICLSKQ